MPASLVALLVLLRSLIRSRVDDLQLGKLGSAPSCTGIAAASQKMLRRAKRAKTTSISHLTRAQSIGSRAEPLRDGCGAPATAAQSVRRFLPEMPVNCVEERELRVDLKFARTKEMIDLSGEQVINLRTASR